MHANRPQADNFMISPDLHVVDDELLVERARTDIDAFEAIYARYGA